MIELDGADAGGQFVRTALSVATLREEPVRIESVRGGRSTPGLRPQHLAVLETLAALSDGAVDGNSVGATTIELEPQSLRGGEFEVDIGTAGSIPLLFDALLPLAARIDEPLRVTATGGTDVAWSPPLDYLRTVKVPVLRRHGLTAAIECDQRGFHPAGGGSATLHLAPATIDEIDLATRGDPTEVSVHSVAAASLADRDVPERQLTGFERRWDRSPIGTQLVETSESACPGSVIVASLPCGTTRLGASALGEEGKPAEVVGESCADALVEALESGAPVDRYLADQLLVFLAIAGGRLVVPSETEHVATSRELLATLGVEWTQRNVAAGLELSVGERLSLPK